MKKLFMLIVLASCVSILSDVAYAGAVTNTNPAPDAYADVVRIVGGSRCKATAAPPSYSEGDEVPLSCELDGDLRTNATGGGGGGAATIADGADVNQGATTDAAATAGGTGTISAKLRLLTTQLDTIQTSIQLLDDAIHASDAALSKVLAIGCQFDDTTPGSTTENSVRSVRCSTRRELYGQIRDAAGNERGANVNASNELQTNANTELPASVLLANGLSLPTTPLVGAVNLVYNGSTLDLGKAATAGAGNTDATTARVTLAGDDPLFVGTSNDHYVSVGTTEDKHQVKATAGRLMAIQVSNSAATVAYLRCANLTAANTTPGTSTVFWGMAIPGSTTGAGMAAPIGGVNGLAFSTALTCWVVTDKAESGVTEVAAGDVQWNIQYK